MQDLAIGSHIKTFRLCYSHHGIYCGDGKVVHYSGFAQTLEKGALEITTMDKFLDGESSVYIVNYPPNEVKFSPGKIIERALSRVGENEYNLIFNNCEHFAVWCVTDKSESKQVKRVLSFTTDTVKVYRTISAASAQTIGLTTSSARIFTGTTAISSSAVGQLTGCATGVLSGAALGTSSALVGGATISSSTALGFSAALGGSAMAVAAPVAVPASLAIGACAVLCGLLGSFFD